MTDPEPATRRGVRLGVDVGAVRVGLARSDVDGLLATPVETVGGDRAAQLHRIAEVAREVAAVGIVVGLPGSSPVPKGVPHPSCGSTLVTLHGCVPPCPSGWSTSGSPRSAPTRRCTGQVVPVDATGRWSTRSLP